MASAIFPVIVEYITTDTANPNYTMVIDHWGPAPRLKGKGLMSGLFAKKTLLNGTKMFLRMFKTSQILDLG